MSKVAILMSTYNGEKYLSKQLESIANQTFKGEIAVYIRDDGSKDNTEKIIDKWQERVHISYRKGKNLGPALSFWNLFSDDSIRADYYAFCDQDDIWDSNKIEKAVEHLNGNVHLYAANCRSIDSSDIVIEKRRKKTAPVFKIEHLFVSGITQGCAMVFTDELREFILRKRITCIPMHDLIVCMYAYYYKDFFWDETPRFSYRFHENNVIARKDRNRLKNLLVKVKKWDKQQFAEIVATELLMNNPDIESDEEQRFLKAISCYKRSLKNKLIVIFNSSIRRCPKSALKSFYLRVLLDKL